MDKLLERLKLEVEEERRRLYIERFGTASIRSKEENKPLKDFN
jgi:hypothetical protein